MTDKDNSIWMPYHELELYEKWKEGQSTEDLKQHAYFFWNNFSMEGYEEFLNQLNKDTDVTQ